MCPHTSVLEDFKFQPYGRSMIITGTHISIKLARTWASMIPQKLEIGSLVLKYPESS